MRRDDERLFLPGEPRLSDGVVEVIHVHAQRALACGHHDTLAVGGGDEARARTKLEPHVGRSLNEEALQKPREGLSHAWQ